MTVLKLTFIYFCLILFYCRYISSQQPQDPSLFPSPATVNLDRFRLLLISSASSSSQTFSCSVKPAASAGDASNIAAAPCATATNSANWIVVSPVVTRGLFVEVVLNTSTTLTSRLTEIIVVACCEDGGAGAAAVAFVDVQPNIEINANFTPPASATIFPNPAYVNIAPCPCNLHLGACDVDCCCDPECTNNQTATFRCSPGVFGGDFTRDDKVLCTTQEYDKPDWHQFTCVQTLNSPDLGLFYSNVTGRQYKVLPSTFDDLASRSKSSFSFHIDSTVAVQSQQPLTSFYRNGDPVRTATTVQGLTSYLVLPQNSLSGQCVKNSIVQFQNNSLAVCELVVDSSSCAAGSVLDVDYYLTDLTDVLSSSAGSITPNVTYYSDDASNYVKTPSATSAVVKTVSLFGATAVSSATVIAKPGSPQNSGTACNNAVVSVTYVMTWSGSAITAVDVSVIVSNVPLSTNGAALTQSFTADWKYAGAGANTVQRSGTLGYEVSLPVISGVRESTTVNVSSNNQLRMWNPGPSGLCAGSDSVAPTFGQEGTSGCMLQLSLVEFDNCTFLRNLVEEQQLNLISSNNPVLVSRIGSPNLTFYSEEQWTLVTKELNASTAVDNVNLSGQCLDIPSQMHLEFVTSVTGRVEGYPIVEILEARVRWIRETWKLSCSGSNSCRNESFVESFPVTSVVSFTSIPSSPITQSQECATDATCWPHLLYPLSIDFYFDQPISTARRDLEYNIAWALLLVFFCVGAALLSFDWSKVTSFHYG